MRKRTKRKVWERRSPIELAVSGAMRFAQHEMAIGYRLITQEAAVALAKGPIAMTELQAIVAAYNITDALVEQGFGAPHRPDVDAAQEAIKSLAKRGHPLKATPEELEAISFMLHIHEAQLEVISVSEYNNAVTRVNNVYSGGGSINLNEGQL